MTKEEQYAKELYQKLQDYLKKEPFSLLTWFGFHPKKDLSISLEGSGYQWGCQIGNRNRQCTVSCLHIDRSDTSYKGPEYYTQFKEQGKIIAEGRTFKKQLTLQAIDTFFRNKPLEYLYQHFSFIDEEKRKLEAL
jgi:hypothetical protein